MTWVTGMTRMIGETSMTGINKRTVGFYDMGYGMNSISRMTRMIEMTRMTWVTRMAWVTRITRITDLIRITWVNRMTRMTGVTRLIGLTECNITRMARVTTCTVQL